MVLVILLGTLFFGGLLMVAGGLVGQSKLYVRLGAVIFIAGLVFVGGFLYRDVIPTHMVFLAALGLLGLFAWIIKRIPSKQSGK